MRSPFADDQKCRSAHKTSKSVTTGYGLTIFLSVLTSAVLMSTPDQAVAQLIGTSGILVEGTGEAKTVPDVVEINLRLVARGELTDDAVVKHRDARKRTMETFQALKLENLQLVEKDLTLRPGNSQEMMQMMMWGNMPSSQNKRTQIEIASMLRARLTDVNKLPIEELMSTIGKLIDAAQDSGAGLGPSDSDMMMRRWYGNTRQAPLVKFVVTNLVEIREKAYELAVADARKRAERLARLSNIKLGAVTAIDEVESGNGQMPYYYYQPMDEDSHAEKTELLADTMSGGRITIRLRVRFAIDAGEANQAVQAEPANKTPIAAQGK